MNLLSCTWTKYMTFGKCNIKPLHKETVAQLLRFIFMSVILVFCGVKGFNKTVKGSPALWSLQL